MEFIDGERQKRAANGEAKQETPKQETPKG